MFNFEEVRKHYSGERPAGFSEFMEAHGVKSDAINSCGVRLTFAIYKAHPSFFKDKKASSAVEWYGLPTRAADVAILLTKYVKKPIIVTSKSEILGKQGIVFFDKIPGFGGTGHIALWNNSDFHLPSDNYIGTAERTYFYDFSLPKPKPK